MGVALGHGHLVGALVGAGGDHRQSLADSSEAREFDARVALQALPPASGFQLALDRVADASRSVSEIRPPLLVARHPVAIVLDRQKVRALLTVARDCDGLGVGVDAVSTNIAMALNGLLCDSAMMRIASQSSPIRSLPPSVDCALRCLAGAMRGSSASGEAGLGSQELPPRLVSSSVPIGH